MKIEPVTQDQIYALARCIGPMGSMVSDLGNVDLSRGRGVLGPHKHCLWTEDGRRITVSVEGGVIVSTAKEPDPEAPPRP